MKYIFLAGAPGSKWSSVCKNIYYSPSIDRSDYSNERTYYHSAWGEPELMHLGAYFDPGMEFGDTFDRMDQYSKSELEAEFDRPFSGGGIRIIKSHVFCHHLDFIKSTWSDCPLILVERPDDACLGWWVRCREFRITYPNYSGYYKNLDNMGKQINIQNYDLRKFYSKNKLIRLDNNIDLCLKLKILNPPVEYIQDYNKSDINVYLSCHTLT